MAWARSCCRAVRAWSGHAPPRRPPRPRPAAPPCHTCGACHLPRPYHRLPPPQNTPPGELPTPDRLAFLLAVVRRVRADTAAADPAHAGLAVALSVGELAAADYAALVAAGASRYLLRIETSSPTLFAALHPPAQAWAVRVRALQAAAAAGLQVGTGVMVGLPGQTLADLAGDLVFFKDIGADMIGEAVGGGLGGEDGVGCVAWGAKPCGGRGCGRRRY